MESFSYSVSGDLRAPLRAIDGFSLVLIEDVCSRLDDTKRLFLHRIRLTSQKLGGVIDDTLQLDRVSRQELSSGVSGCPPWHRQA